jgi:hypothetical protein
LDEVETASGESATPSKAPVAGASSPQKGFDYAINNFVPRILSLRVCLEQTKGTLISAMMDTVKDFSQFVDQYKVAETNDSYQLKLNRLDIYTLLNKTRRLQRNSYAITALLNALFSNAISTWDNYFSDLLIAIFELRPDIIDGSQRELKFSDLKKFSSLADARKFVIDSEVEEVMRKSHAEQFKYLENKRVITKINDDRWHRFIEMTERRNLIIHTDGFVNEQYISVCKANGIQVDTSVGNKLAITQQYLDECCNILYEFGVKLGHSIWRSLSRNEQNAQDAHLFLTTYSLIEDGYYDIAIKLLEFALTPPMKYGSQDSKLKSVINLAQANKWVGNQEKCIQILDGQEWTVHSEDFRLANLVLRGRFEEASRLMLAIGKEGRIKRRNYDSWPLFTEFRQTEFYSRIYSELFGDTEQLQQVSKELVLGSTDEQEKDLPAEEG